MAQREISQVHLDRLNEIKEKVESWYSYWGDNIQRFSSFTTFTYLTALTTDEKNKLLALGKPPVEFNFIEGLINTQLGDFSAQEPIPTAFLSNGAEVDDANLAMLKFLENHIREKLSAAGSDNAGRKIYADQLGGGFGVGEIYLDYVGKYSFDKEPFWRWKKDPVMCGFDPMAEETHKGDGDYCFELEVRRADDAAQEYGINPEKLQSAGAGGTFNWAYEHNEEKYVIICYFYEKKKKKITLIQLDNGRIMNKKDYPALVEMWQERRIFGLPPAPLPGREKREIIETIVCYTICGYEVLDYAKTDYSFLPLVYFPGNSKYLKRGDRTPAVEVTRPYAFHAKDTQKVCNYSGQTMVSDIENLITHPLMAAVESLPDDYLSEWRKPQRPGILLYQAYNEDGTTNPLPVNIPHTPLPQIVENLFMTAPKISQTILASYDSVLATNEKNVSGVAIQRGKMQTAAAVTPFIENYVASLNRVGEIFVDLICKYYVTPRTIPVKDASGRRSYQVINDPTKEGNLNISYKPGEIGIRIEAGVNMAIQQELALEQVTKYSQANPQFQAFMGDVGLPFILDNMNIRGIDELKKLADDWIKQQQMLKEQAMNQPNPEAMVAEAMAQAELEKVQVMREGQQLRAQEKQGELVIDAAKVANEKLKVDAQIAEIMSEIDNKNAKIELEQERVDSENARSAVEAAINLGKHNREELTQTMKPKKEVVKKSAAKKVMAKPTAKAKKK